MTVESAVWLARLKLQVNLRRMQPRGSGTKSPTRVDNSIVLGEAKCWL